MTCAPFFPREIPVTMVDFMAGSVEKVHVRRKEAAIANSESRFPSTCGRSGLENFDERILRVFSMAIEGLGTTAPLPSESHIQE